MKLTIQKLLTNPICSGKHRAFAAEPDEKIIVYDQEANKIEIQIPEEIASKLRKI